MLNCKLLTAVLGAAVFISAVSVQAEVLIVDSRNRLIKSTPQQQTVQGSTSELFYQLQIMQREVQTLRGLVEEQGYQIKRLKKQRLDDYINLDRRISASAPVVTTPADTSIATPLLPEASTPSVTAAASPSVNVPRANSTAPVVAPATATSESEVKRYRASIDLVLNKKDYPGAIQGFNEYLRDYPNGRYAANSEYWLGEIYLMQGDLEPARQRFARMIENYPDSSKAPDAIYKLGILHHRMGDIEKSRSFMDQAVAAGGNAARLANDFIAKNW